jgi:hypothetical protein
VKQTHRTLGLFLLLIPCSLRPPARCRSGLKPAKVFACESVFLSLSLSISLSLFVSVCCGIFFLVLLYCVHKCIAHGDDSPQKPMRAHTHTWSVVLAKFRESAMRALALSMFQDRSAHMHPFEPAVLRVSLTHSQFSLFQSVSISGTRTPLSLRAHSKTDRQTHDLI